MRNKIKDLLTNPHIQQSLVTGVTIAAGAATIVQVFDTQLVDKVKDLNETIGKESKAIQKELKDLKISNQKNAENIINNQNKLMEELKKQQSKSNNFNITLDDVNRSIGIIDGILRIFVNIKSLLLLKKKKES